MDRSLLSLRLLSVGAVAMSAAAMTAYHFHTANRTADANASGPVTGLAIAEQVVSFVDASLDVENQTFLTSYKCSHDEQRCIASDNGDTPPHIGHAILSLEEAGRAVGNDRLIEKSARLFEYVTEKCETDDYRYCEWHFFPFHIKFIETEDERYAQAMTGAEGSLMKERPMRELTASNIAIKWWMLYDVTGEERYRDRLLALADEQLDRYPEERPADDVIHSSGHGEVRSRDIPIIWGVFLPAFEASGDRKYLEPVRAFFDATDLAGAATTLINEASTIAVIQAADVSIRLAELYPDDAARFRETSRRLLEALLNERWDTPERRLANGDHGILTSAREKGTNLNGWLIRSLLKLKDEEFVLTWGL